MSLFRVSFVSFCSRLLFWSASVCTQVTQGTLCWDGSERVCMWQVRRYWRVLGSTSTSFACHCTAVRMSFDDVWRSSVHCVERGPSAHTAFAINRLISRARHNFAARRILATLCVLNAAAENWNEQQQQLSVAFYHKKSLHFVIVLLITVLSRHLFLF